MRDRFGAKDPRSLVLRFHTQTAGSTLTAQQPLVNVVRTTLQALAAVLGGTQSLHTNAYDEALGAADRGLGAAGPAHAAGHRERDRRRRHRRSARRRVRGRDADAARSRRRARELIGKIDALGGMIAAIEQGFPQREIEQRAYEYQRSIEDKQRTIVGVNDYVLEGETPTAALQLDPALERDQVERVRALRARRDARAWEGAIARLEAAARGTDNLLPHILAAVKAHATVGEIADAFRRPFGDRQSTDPTIGPLVSSLISGRMYG